MMKIKMENRLLILIQNLLHLHIKMYLPISIKSYNVYFKNSNHKDFQKEDTQYPLTTYRYKLEKQFIWINY